MTADGTVMSRLRSPALITTSAVITLVMLAMGRSVFRSRLHRIRPVAALAIAASLACTPLGPAVTVAVRAGLATDAGAVAASATKAARSAVPARPVTRIAS